MSHIETNIYFVKNPGELDCRYRCYRARGIPDSEDYQKNMQLLVKVLSSQTRSPCVLFTRNGDRLVAQPEGYAELPDSVELIRATAKLEKLPEANELNFSALTPAVAGLASRFLQFSIQSSLKDIPGLWQPRSGYPFYSKYPDLEFKQTLRSIDLYRGFAFRVVILPDGRIGVCVDAKSKYVSADYLPTKIDAKECRDRYKGLNCLYEYGNTWYEIRIEGRNDLNVSDVLFSESSLFEDVHKKAGAYKSQALRTLPKDCSVLTYRTSLGETRNAPSGLCRLTYGTGHPEIKPYHSMTIRFPTSRRAETQFVINKYFSDLSFGNAKISLSDKPLYVNDTRIMVPDLEFGGGKVLSLCGDKKAAQTSLDNFPSKKKELLYSKDAGLYVMKPFDRQYFIMPQSIFESMGKSLMGEIEREVQRLFPDHKEIVYNPIVIPYDDSVHRTMHNIAREVERAVEENNVEHGYGILMIHRLPTRNKKREDQLANFLMRRLREMYVYVSIIHTDVTRESYRSIVLEDGTESWVLIRDQKQISKFKGYVKNVVLNKILITNNMWPFALKTPLNADLTIGIDVKNNTAGFTLIHKNGADIRFFSSESAQKEQLSKNHVSSKIYEIVRDEQNLQHRKIKTIVVHRQGTLFPSEQLGIMQALKRLADEKLLDEGYSCNLVEIRTTSRIPLRLFRVTTPLGGQKEIVNNPTIGACAPILENETFICTTGYPYPHKGTTNPLHVIKIEGEMPLDNISEDVFYLSNLTWTKIDDCSRLPISIKINDIRLREIAGEYDVNAIKFGEEE